MSMKRNVFRSLLDRVQRLGFLSLVMVRLAILHIVPPDFPKNFP
ncbi:MAG: hypothetical protein WBQ20_06575 [Methyloceanibacter sp.]